MFGGKGAGLSWQQRMAQQYGGKNPGFGSQPASTYAQQAKIAEQAARNRELGKGITWQPWKNPKTPLSSPMKGPPPGLKPGITGASTSVGKGVIAKTALGAAGKISSAITAFQVGWGIGKAILNWIDPTIIRDSQLDGPVSLEKELDRPIEKDGGERETPLPPAPAPGQPYPPGSGSITSSVEISGISASGFVHLSYPNGSQNDGVGAGCVYNIFVGYFPYHLHLQIDSQYTTTVEPIQIKRYGSVWMPNNPGQHLNRSSGQYWSWLNQWYVEYDMGQLLTFSATSVLTIKKLDFKGQDATLKNPLYAASNNDPYSPQQFLWWNGFRWVNVTFRPIPAISRFVRYVIPDEPLVFPDYSYPSHEINGDDPFKQRWKKTDTWNTPQREDEEMPCDLSPIMQQLQQQKGQITTLQNTVNNISLNSSSIQNINANTTTVVNNAISSINSNTSSAVNTATNSINTNTVSAVNTATNSINTNTVNAVNTATNAINTNTVSAVNTATNAINTNTVSTVNTAANAINSNTVSTVNTAANAINSNTVSTVNTAASAINSNIASLSAKLSQVADDILIGVKNGFAALEAWLRPALNLLDEAVKAVKESLTKLSEVVGKFLKWIQFDRVLNLLILVSTIHNAAMLSNQLGSSLISMANSLLTAGGNALGLRGVEDEPIDIGPAVSGAFNGLVDGFIGKETNSELKKQWNKYNRIYQAAANLLGSIQSLNQSILSALEIVGGKVARIGNALKKWGEVSESAFNWMNPQPFFSNPFSRFAEKSQQGVETTDQVAQEVISSQQQVSQIQKEIDDFKELLDKEEKTGIPAPTPAKTTATETEAKTNSTAGATPLLISEKP
ncbi:hypothetical protein NG798_09385 [Ancylothrix sp. C2]|uniref:hypothetical protein n=1 Tax=Ancylothrix sp. D3o TaxID=2953691 RepID=UPI0021BA8BDB|nr:hypothetical protein [Ancylothrix sp. D3o]MCT7949998.1 hypothetical protein [Ancylothrix sp. D3o]